MCLLTRQTEPIILKEDKVVWKLMFINEDGEVSSLFYYFKWVIGRLYKCNISIGDDVTSYDDKQGMLYRDKSYNLKPGVISIDKGFHSFNNLEYAQEIVDYGEYIYECIIPAGSEYYEDETGLCVSNQIIIVKQL